jgi:hypothetical protein
MQVVAGNAACSIAFRNCVFKVVPMALVKPVYEAAKKVATGDVKTLASRRAAAVEYFLKLGVPKERILASVGVGSVEDIQLAHLEQLTGFRTAIADGDSSIEEVFPAPAAPSRPVFLKSGKAEGAPAEKEAGTNPDLEPVPAAKEVSS